MTQILKRKNNKKSLPRGKQDKKNLLALYLQKGLSLSEACILAKVGTNMLATFRSDVDFDNFVREMQLYFEADLIDQVSSVGKSGYWQASAWLLERKFPEKYGKKDTVKHEYEIKLMTFQKVVLDVIDNVDPALKLQIVQKLKKLSSEESENVSNVLDVELIEN